jgi:hypothetical protein
MTPRTRPCSQATKRGRLHKAEQFLEAAETIVAFADDVGAVGDPLVTLCVHAGIAAADAICCEALNEHAAGESHAEAIALIGRVRPDGKNLSAALGTLLAVKTRAGYASESVNAGQRKRAQRAAEKLVKAARARVTA